MSAQKTESTTNEDILAAVDELFEALALTNAAIAALHKKVDRAREVNLETLAHCKRLVQKDEDMMRSMGIYGLVRRANDERDDTPSEREAQSRMAKAAPLFETIKNSPLMKPKEHRS